MEDRDVSSWWSRDGVMRSMSSKRSERNNSFDTDAYTTNHAVVVQQSGRARKVEAKREESLAQSMAVVKSAQVQTEEEEGEEQKQEYIEELNISRQEKMNELLKSAHVLRSGGKDESGNSMHLEAASSMLLNPLKVNPSHSPHALASLNDASFNLYYVVASVSPTSITLTLNSTAKATVWCQASEVGLLDRNSIQLHKQGTNIKGRIRSRDSW